MNRRTPPGFGLFTSAVIAFVVPVDAADLRKQDGVVLASNSIPAAYPSVGSGPAPRDNATNIRNRPPVAAPSVGQIRSSTRPMQKQVVAPAEPAVQAILPEQLLGLPDIAFDRVEAEKPAINSVGGAGNSKNIEAEQSRLALGLVRNLISSVNQANLTDDYSVLWAQMAPAVQAAHTPASMAEQLTPLRDINFDLIETLVARPTMQTRLTAVNGVPVLVAEGEFAATGRKVMFVAEFRRQGGRWQVRRFRIDVPPQGEPATGTRMR